MNFRIKKIGKETPNPFEELLNEVTTGIQNLFPSTKELAHDIVLKSPPDHIEADYSFSTFSIASLVSQDPIKIATRIVEYFSENPLTIIKKMYAIGPYVNIEIDRQLYRKKTLNHILNQGKQFGAYYGKNPSIIFINYFSSDFTPRLTLDGLRTLLVGKAISECYKLGGNTVRQEYYIADWDTEKVGFLYALSAWRDEITKTSDSLQELDNATVLLRKKIIENEGVKTQLKKYFQELQTGRSNDLRLFKNWRKIILKNIRKTHREVGIRISSYTTESEFVSLGREVVDDARKQSLAGYAANTQAIIISSFDNTPSLVLQKNDGSVTSFVRHLAYIKCCLSETRLSTFICVSAKGQAHVVEALLTNARRLKYLPMGIKVSTMFINQAEKQDLPLRIDPSLQYTILRMSLNKEIELESEDHTYYSHIVSFIDQLTPRTKKTDLINEFSIIKLLISFPMIIADVQSSHEPSHLCAYLEEVLQQCEKLSVGQDKLLSKAVAVVLKNGLNLLTS